MDQKNKRNWRPRNFIVKRTGLTCWKRPWEWGAPNISSCMFLMVDGIFLHQYNKILSNQDTKSGLNTTLQTQKSNQSSFLKQYRDAANNHWFAYILQRIFGIIFNCNVQRHAFRVRLILAEDFQSLNHKGCVGIAFRSGTHHHKCILYHFRVAMICSYGVEEKEAFLKSVKAYLKPVKQTGRWP